MSRTSRRGRVPEAVAERQDFFRLDPERVLAAVESAGLACRPLCYPLNSFENRVYELELEDRSRIVAKFYRPGRWSAEQIGEEHGLLAELAASELPVCAVRPFPDGATLRSTFGIHYAIWDRRGGRAPDELDPSLALRLGMFVGRMHNVAAAKSFRRRPRLDAETYVAGEAAWLERERIVPDAFASRYLRACDALAELAEGALQGAETLRLHADLHLGNVLLRDGELRLLDFDDAATGPPVQDMWLAIPGRDARSLQLRDYFLDGYERFRRFDRGSLRLVELLRGMRMVRYCAWLARRWDDPAFRAGWPDFGGEDYWRTTTADLEEQLGFVRAGLASAPETSAAGAGGGFASPAPADAAELTNKDYFWDWEGD
jgi:Ser/Thr protein kinase RdoA (MazF antagonist)